jgi:hypothetical protein
MSKGSSTAVPSPRPAEPLGERGHGDRTWTPEPGEQGISNRVGDEEPAAETDAASFGHDRKNVVSMSDEDPIDDPDDADEDDFDEDAEEDDAEEGDEEDEEDEDDEDDDTDEPKERSS